jgi:hypothetical protein
MKLLATLYFSSSHSNFLCIKFDMDLCMREDLLPKTTGSKFHDRGDLCAASMSAYFDFETIQDAINVLIFEYLRD